VDALFRSLSAAFCIALLAAGPSLAADVSDGAAPESAATPETGASGTTGASAGEKDAEPAAAAAAAAKSPPPVAGAEKKAPTHATVLKDFKPVAGLIPLYHKDSRLYGELTAATMNTDFIVLISIARGISQRPIFGGYSWSIGDDWIWQFRKVDDRIHVVRRNVRFRAKANTPEASAVKMAYTDSVLYSLPIVTTGPKGGHLVDLTSIFMSDLPQISQVLRGFAFAPTKSTWAEVKGFKDNVELQVAATYASSGASTLETVPDSRGVTIHVHYSISKLPSTGYKPRMADNRVGYFVTAVKDFSLGGDDDRFARYVNRWDLQKADPSLAESPPKKPIIFWIEKTAPLKYRKSIRDGILEWNKSFEKIGFAGAIEVRQQPNDATWDPEDVHYNTFRWITASAGFAMGPSRVNPLTGQILDADIIFDADFLHYWKNEFELYTPESVAALTGGPLDLVQYARQRSSDPHNHLFCRGGCCSMHQGFSRQLALGSAVLAARPRSEAETEKMIRQALKEVTMHEVGHTLGLRHNFKASTLYNLEDLNNPEKTRDTGLAASVMDYMPANLAPGGKKQGDYYSQTIGPYDMWAIEYGYKPLSGGTEGEVAELKKIAARSGQSGHVYLTDEDTRGIDPDPLSNRFDLGNDSVAYATQRAEVIAQLWPGLIERSTKDGEGYEKVRRAFNVLLGDYGQAMFFVARNVGGVYVSRSHKGDKDARDPFVVVDATKQREALALLESNVFGDKPFAFPPELYNHLAASRWNHWGTQTPTRTDYPAHGIVLMWQERVLDQLLSSLTLTRLHDSELKTAPETDAFTTAELLERLTAAIFSETESLGEGEFTTRKPAVSSLRRNLQRTYLKRLGNLALGYTGAPEDCQTIAYAQLKSLQRRLGGVLLKQSEGEKLKLDAYTRAHFEESSDRIQKILDARLQISAP
jgi:hypothetical protein